MYIQECTKHNNFCFRLFWWWFQRGGHQTASVEKGPGSFQAMKFAAAWHAIAMYKASFYWDKFIIIISALWPKLTMNDVWQEFKCCQNFWRRLLRWFLDVRNHDHLWFQLVVPFHTTQTLLPTLTVEKALKGSASDKKRKAEDSTGQALLSP